MIKYCVGCGIRLQDKDEFCLGYVPSMDKDYCMRCFRLTNYHENKDIVLTSTNEELLSNINKGDGVVYFFCDFLSLYGDNLNLYEKITLPKRFIISKKDIIPKSVVFANLRKWLKDKYDIDDVLLVSVKNTHELENKIMNEKYQNIYFAGPTNAGKSSIINSLLETKKITVSENANTTLNFIKNIYKGKTIFDTIGFISVSNGKVGKQIKEKSYPLKENEFLKINDFVLTVDQKMNVVFFGSNEVNIKKVYHNDLVLNEFEIIKPSNVYLLGLGFVYISRSCKIKVFGDVRISDSFLGGSHEQN